MKSLGSRWLLLLLAWQGATPSRAIAQASPDRLRYSKEMLHSLRGELEREWKHLEEHLAFSGSSLATDRSHAHNSAIKIMILTATDSGWSAIVMHDSLPGAACGVFYGSAPPPIDPSAEDGVVTCTPQTTIDQAALRSPVGKRVYLERELAPDSQPAARGCSKPTTWSGVARLRLIVDASGHLRPSPLKINKAGSLSQAAQALDVIESCRWTPGRANGVPVPTITDVYLH